MTAQGRPSLKRLAADKRRSTGAVILTLALGGFALGAFALVFGFEAGYLASLQDANTPSYPALALFAQTTGLATLGLCFAMGLAAAITASPRRIFFAGAAIWSVVAIGLTFWILTDPAPQMQIWNVSLDGLVLTLVGLIAFLMAALSLIAALYAWVVTPDKPIWHAATRPDAILLPPPTHQG